jgi:hypothetical protein
MRYAKSQHTDSKWVPVTMAWSVLGLRMEGSCQEWKKKTRNASQDSRCPGRDLNRVPSQYRPKVSPLNQPTRWWPHTRFRTYRTIASQLYNHQILLLSVWRLPISNGTVLSGSFGNSTVINSLHFSLFSWISGLHILLPRYGASSDCGWRRRPADMEGNCEYTE